MAMPAIFRAKAGAPEARQSEWKTTAKEFQPDFAQRQFESEVRRSAAAASARHLIRSDG
jgi:hypothetical protein